jgi:steroid delta-isomerase-like uncharacterized protein
MSLESTMKVMNQYFSGHQPSAITFSDDVVFTIMSTGQEHRGPEEVSQMLVYFYQIAFQASAEKKNTIFADGQAVWEGDLVGMHVGEFAGIPATGKEVRVPLCVVYDLENDRIQRGRVYFKMPVLMAQLGVSG